MCLCPSSAHVFSWSRLPQYEALAHSDSERYASEVASALEAAGPRARAGAGGEKRARGRKAKAKAEADGEVEAGAAKPRRKLSGYLLFTKERRAEVRAESGLEPDRFLITFPVLLRYLGHLHPTHTRASSHTPGHVSPPRHCPP